MSFPPVSMNRLVWHIVEEEARISLFGHLRAPSSLLCFKLKRAIFYVSSILQYVE